MAFSCCVRKGLSFLQVESKFPLCVRGTCELFLGSFPLHLQAFSGLLFVESMVAGHDLALRGFLNYFFVEVPSNQDVTTIMRMLL